MTKVNVMSVVDLADYLVVYVDGPQTSKLGYRNFIKVLELLRTDYKEYAEEMLNEET